jgi:hypothetical protein
MTQLHPSELSAHLSYRLRATALMWGASALAFGLAMGSLALDELQDRRLHWVRTGLLTTSLGAASLAYFSRENMVQRSLISLDIGDISDASRQQRLYEAMKPGAESAVIELPLPPWKPDLFDWGRLVTEPDKHPHLILLGATGDGKTTLAEWLHGGMVGAKVAIHPHWQASDDPTDSPDFAYCGQVIGGGRDFEAISAVMGDLHDEMSDRAKLSKSALRQKPILAIAIDELPAISKNCGEAVTEQIISLLFEARKFRMRVVLLAQADSVKILGLEGQGAVRENLTYIRLGQCAIDHARWLINKKLARPELLEWMERQPRPCMVEDAPALVPTIRKGDTLSGYFQSDETPLSLGVNLQGGAGGGLHPLHLRSTLPGGGAPPLEIKDSTSPPPPSTCDPLNPEITPEEWQRVVNLRQGGESQDNIIKTVWGVAKSGSDPRYKSARDKYRAIVDSAGLS